MTTIETSLAAPALQRLLDESAAQHRHLCPRQVLGVRAGLLAGHLLGIAAPQPHDSKRLLTIVEADGCFATGISSATNCHVGRRTLRVEDYGKLAATFIDTHSGRALRLRPRLDLRQYALERAAQLAPEARGIWQIHLLVYQRLPDDTLFDAQEVELSTPLAQIISHKRNKAICAQCGEEINNEREVWRGGLALCRACAGGGYYRPR